MSTGPDYDSVTRWLETRQRLLLLSHQRPDGDALGALAAMAVALARRGATPQVALFDPYPPRYALLEDCAAWRDWDRHGEELRRFCDGVVIVDTCAHSQLEPAREWLDRAPPTLVIDHHATHDGIAGRPGDLRLIDTGAAAVCVLVAEWVPAFGAAVDAELATPLFVGLATDTGWFRFSNTDARAMRIAAALLDVGVQADAVHRALYQQDHPAKLRLISRMLATLELHGGGRIASMTLREADFRAAGADRTMTEDLVNEAGRLGGVEVLLLCTEDPGGVVRVNLRSKQYVDVAALARSFGGGGHPRAAGARVRGGFAEVQSRVLAAATAALR